MSAFKPKTPYVDDQKQAKMLLLESFLKIIFYFNYTFNFVLYCLSGTVFYEELKNFVKDTKRKLFKLCVQQAATDGRHTSTTLTAPTTDGVPNSTEF